VSSVVELGAVFRRPDNGLRRHRRRGLCGSHPRGPTLARFPRPATRSSGRIRIQASRVALSRALRAAVRQFSEPRAVLVTGGARLRGTVGTRRSRDPRSPLCAGPTPSSSTQPRRESDSAK
jgi:hypothetical protein